MKMILQSFLIAALASVISAEKYNEIKVRKLNEEISQEAVNHFGFSFFGGSFTLQTSLRETAWELALNRKIGQVLLLLVGLEVLDCLLAAYACQVVTFIFHDYSSIVLTFCFLLFCFGSLACCCNAMDCRS
jgi:hypothetical protein